MVFSSLLFLFLFLPMTILLYFIAPKKYKNIVLLIVSLLFYSWGEPVYIVLMIFTACVDYLIGLFVHKYRENSPLKAKIALISSLIINIAVLSFFKYADFLIENINSLLGTHIGALQLPLPIGISFYTFQTMSYVIDVYRGKFAPQKNPFDFAMYVSFFPQLIAGPIVRYEVIEENLKNRKWDPSLFAEGIRIFTIGLGKKVLLANNIGLLWSTIQNHGISEISLLTAWLGIICFGLQIYFDFSGYSDMAIGLGKMFGFHFPKNFDYPYTSKSVTEFWRRWHMTLGSWFRDYVYIPLGGSKEGKINTYRNLFVVWALTGLWHGASWNFVIWGIYFGLLIAIEKAGLSIFLNRIHPVFQHLYLLLCVLIGWVFFVFEDIKDGLSYLKIMFGFSGNPLMDTTLLYYLSTHFMLLFIVILASTPIFKKLLSNTNFFTFVFCVFILFLSTAYLVDSSYNPFLYFRF